MRLQWDHPLASYWAPQVIKTLVQGYLRTCRLMVVAGPETARLMASGRSVIYTMWHGQLLYPLYYFSRQYVAPGILASPSRDGELIAAVAGGWGYVVCRGSQRKGGIQALKDMAAHLRQGHSGGIMADGSRGPARVAQKGVLFLAREARAPLIPMAVAASRKKTFSSWDRFEMPLPFSRLALLMGEPLKVPPREQRPDLEPLRQELEQRLQALYRQSQTYFHP